MALLGAGLLLVLAGTCGLMASLCDDFPELRTALLVVGGAFVVGAAGLFALGAL